MATHTTALVHYEAAKTELAKASRIDEVKTIQDQAAALEHYGRQAKDSDIERWGAEIKLRAQRRLGEISRALPKSKGGKNPESTLPSDGRVKRDVLAQAGVSTQDASRAEQVAAIPVEAFELVIAEKTRHGQPVTAADVVTQVKRQTKEQAKEQRRAQNQEAIEQGDNLERLTGVFSTIVIDPPWDWGDEGDIDQLGRAKPPYRTMPYADLLALSVGTFADVDCHLYLWMTNRSLPKGFGLLEAWGFRYVTCLTWVKPSFGMGTYFRGSTEHVLFGVKGSQGLRRKDVPTHFLADRGPRGHSSKPLSFYALVESCSPGPYLEMFSRHDREGWVMWGVGDEASAAV